MTNPLKANQESLLELGAHAHMSTSPWAISTMDKRQAGQYTVRPDGTSSLGLPRQPWADEMQLQSQGLHANSKAARTAMFHLHLKGAKQIRENYTLRTILPLVTKFLPEWYFGRELDLRFDRFLKFQRLGAATRGHPFICPPRTIWRPRASLAANHRECHRMCLFVLPYS